MARHAVDRYGFGFLASRSVRFSVVREDPSCTQCQARPFIHINASKGAVPVF